MILVIDERGKIKFNNCFSASKNARVAQLVEQRIENPCVDGSIPPPGTTDNSDPAVLQTYRLKDH